jgi:uncharacterized membrane protein
MKKTSIFLLFWLILGTILRFTNLGAKPASSIEISTLVFSLGNSLKTIPINQIISLDQLLTPLKYSPTNTIFDVWQNLMAESTHPPLFFVLTHGWLKLFFQPDQIVSLTVERSLSALLGILAIPTIFIVAKLIFDSVIIATIAAGLMAVSPYGIYLSQEARHYTLAILQIIIVLGCLILSLKKIQQGKNISIIQGFIWVITNSLGIATHYFFSIFIATQALVISGFLLQDFQRYCQLKSIKLKQGLFNLPLISKFVREKSNWWGIYIVGIFTLIGCLIWLPFLQGVSENELVSWIESQFSIEKIFLPSIRIIAWILTIVFLLPVEGVNLSVIIISSVIMLTYFIWVIYPLWRGCKLQLKRPASFPAIQILISIFVSAIALFLLIIYVRGADISVAPRYHFIYFPTVLLLGAASLGILWQNPDKLLDQVNITTIKDQSIIQQIIHKIGQTLWANTTGKQVVIITLIMGLLGSFTVVNNYGYQKSRDSDLLVNQIQAKSKSPMIIATSYETFSEVRGLMALGLEFYNKHNQLAGKSLNNQDKNPRFILVETSNNQTDNPSNLAVNIDNLSPLVLTMSRPVDFWAVNLRDIPDLSAFNCQQNSEKMPKIKGYKYRHYRCL